MQTIKHRMLSMLRQFKRNHLDTAQLSYAQCGEDLILQYLLRILGVERVLYLDIGAHHPSYLSNTYLFYRRGGKGVCIEPDPTLFVEFPQKRPRDMNLNCGIGTVLGVADFYVMSNSTLNTFSRDEAQRYQSYGQAIVKEVKIELKSVNDILAQYFDRVPDLVSLDVEGLDYQIMQSFDFGRFRPPVFCLETLTYTEDQSERKLTEIIELMHDNGYMTYADTYINTIFVDKAVWSKRRK